MSGLADIKAKIEHLGLGGATVDLGCGSVDAQPSEGGEILHGVYAMALLALLALLALNTL